MLNYFTLFFLLFFLIPKAFSESKLFMLTDDTCVYCIVWEKQIGKIYSKTDLSNTFPLKRMNINKINKFDKQKLFNTDITPTFVFYINKKEIGRIIGYSNPEMFWWQVDEIIGK